MENGVSTEKLIGLFRALAAILIQGLSACQFVQSILVKNNLTEEERAILVDSIKHCGSTVERLVEVFNAITPDNLLRILNAIDFNRPSISDSQNLEKLCAIVGVDKSL